jgi:hypothetical protein
LYEHYQFDGLTNLIRKILPLNSTSIPAFQPTLPSLKIGLYLLKDGYASHGSGFTREERERLRLTGILSYKVFTIEEQA